MANTKMSAKNNSDAQKIQELEKTISDLNAVVQMLMQQGVSTQAVETEGERDVVFISLCNHILNLSTEPNGGGTIYTFTEFGEEQAIPYSDARKIIKNTNSFIKGGKRYIADDKIINTEHLTSDYKKILSKDDLLDLLSSDRVKFRNIFDKMTPIQQEIFRDVVVDKLSKDKNSVDMNIVQYINESLNIDILKSIDYNKELLVVKDEN